MASTWQTVRVFISSTFRDMHAERDHLIKVVFPALRESLLKDHIYLDDIDLRWGVTSEQAENDRVLDLCLKQIDYCRPYFIGILGERYGWVPLKFPADACRSFGWIQDHPGTSVTELEILHGVLNDPAMTERAFFYLRDPAFKIDVPPERRHVYLEGPTEQELRELSPQAAEACAENRRQKLRELKENLRVSQPELFVYNYPCRWDATKSDPVTKQPGRLIGLEAFGESVRLKLDWAIRTDPKLQGHFAALAAAPIDPFGLAEEQDYHERFMESRLRVYVGREQLNNELLAFADGNDLVPCLVTGSSGSGKSAALARFVRDYRHRQPQTLVIPHFVGASPRSTNLRDVLRRFCQVFKAHFGFTEDVPEEVAKLSVTFREFVTKVPADMRVLLVIDALNQLDEADRAQELYWLPTKLPPQVKVIVSCITDSGKTEPVLEAFRWRKPCPVQVTALSPAEQRLIIGQVPSLSAKTLDELQTGLLLSNPATENPLFLLVALEELRGFGSFEQLDGKIARFPHPQEQVPRWHHWLLETQANARNHEALAQSSGDEVEARKWRGQLDRLELIVPILEAITPISDTVTAIFTQVIERLEIDFVKPEDVVRTILTLLASARRGLSERELLDLVEGPGVPIAASQSDLFPVLRQLRPYLLSRGGLIDFYHRNLRKAVCERYLPSEVQQRQAHGRLADYFHAQDYWLESLEAQRQRAPIFPPNARLANVRKVTELSWQWFRAKQWTELEGVLCDFEFVRAKCVAGMTAELVRDYSDAEAAWPDSAGRNARKPNHSAVPRTVVPEGIRVYSSFVSTHAGIFSRDASQVLPFAYNYAGGGPVVAAADRLLTARHWESNPWIKLVDRPPLTSRPALIRTLDGHESSVTSVAVSDDGVIAVSASEDGAIRIWDIVTTDQRYTLPASMTGRATCVVLTPDGKVAASCGRDGQVRLWDVETGSPLNRNVELGAGEATSVALTADGRMLLAGGIDGIVRVWDVPNGYLAKTLVGHRGRVTHVAISRDGSVAASASLDGTLRVWDTRRGDILATLSGHPFDVQGLCVNGDGNVIVSCCGQPPGWYGNRENLRGTMVRADVRAWTSNGAVLLVGEGHVIGLQRPSSNLPFSGILGGIVYDVAVTADGTMAASVGYDGAVCLWDLHRGCLSKRIDCMTGALRSVAVDHSGSIIITGGDDHRIRVWYPEGDAPARIARRRRIDSIGCGMPCTLNVKTILIWDNRQLRNWVLTPILGLIMLLASPKSGYLIVDFLAAFSLAWVIIPGIAWHTESLRWGHSLVRSLGKIRPLRMWPLLPLCPIFRVVHCPSCGSQICGRKRLFQCSRCGFQG